jgi:hypothetical protein
MASRLYMDTTAKKPPCSLYMTLRDLITGLDVIVPKKSIPIVAENRTPAV